MFAARKNIPSIVLLVTGFYSLSACSASSPSRQTYVFECEEYPSIVVDIKGNGAWVFLPSGTVELAATNTNRPISKNTIPFLFQILQEASAVQTGPFLTATWMTSSPKKAPAKWPSEPP